MTGTRYIFGFDAGTASGAWSVIDTQKMKIIASGLYPNTPEDKRTFKAQIHSLFTLLFGDFDYACDVILEDVIPMKNTMTANLALQKSIAWVDGFFNAVFDLPNIQYIDPAKGSNHPLGCWLKEFGLTDMYVDTAGLCRKEISKKKKEACNEETIRLAREIYGNANDFLSKPSKPKPAPKKPSKKISEPKERKPDPNIATSMLIAEFWRRHRK